MVFYGRHILHFVVDKLQFLHDFMYSFDAKHKKYAKFNATIRQSRTFKWLILIPKLKKALIMPMYKL